jgi:hypothetical protein
LRKEQHLADSSAVQSIKTQNAKNRREQYQEALHEKAKAALKRWDDFRLRKQDMFEFIAKKQRDIVRCKRMICLVKTQALITQIHRKNNFAKMHRQMQHRRALNACRIINTLEKLCKQHQR